ncbi:alkanesulfonate monooxygenase SsuD/methylene tetrahydromethanopterin reductase-like flavin-dependent oxidoreductase (luciferase family) [Actinomycetospora succinea]|uniref:Alkanesulfonate monooxygenase SsuD/methylene tetrahydromethanopterin reductase-like flavin-dependent oxidoreductase (Luciferase family) n=1 Tax=Actinomycetospora succinea TaxID=663603 RepID=A0A4V3D7C2_9PSEU|nr:LLM class flavin-dependent oxidoreductase [Actinomycetospora succinea]TDQ47307.1 alkanesulfonate monooxygenase SsuD/methylene tetrahydromethanopterin reductase-like flavin-dependent oxidoreductase (luciferase family) [Actinomycetospora succinea]
MRLGLFLVSPQWPGRSHGEALAETVRLAVLADRRGLDDVWLAEHHFVSYGVCPSATTLAAHLLAATPRIGVGTAVSVLPVGHPVALAEQAAMLDQLAPGRLTLGVGRGGPWRELVVQGGGTARFERGFAEELDALLGAWRGPVAGEGPTLTFPEVGVVPCPATPGGPPVRVAATSAATVDLAADRDLPLLLGMHADDAERGAMVRRWDARAGRAGEHVGVGIAHVASTRAAAQRAVRAALPTWLGPGLAGHVRADGAPRTLRDPVAYTDLLCGLHPVGTVDDLAEHLEGTAAATGLRRFALMVQTTGDPARTTETVEALAHVRDLLSDSSEDHARGVRR